MAENFDLIIIGAGPGGYETAAEAAAEGRRVLLVERDLPGGTCLNRGCIPTKALCRSAQVAMDAAEAAKYGVACGPVSVDFGAVMARKDAVVAQLREGVVAQLAKVEVKSGEAQLAAGSRVIVGDEEFTAPAIIIATGSAPASLPIEGAELAINSDRLLQADSLPKSLTIIGGGVIGMEFASIMAAFGVEVNVVEYCPEILPPFDREVAKRLRSLLSRRGINIAVGAEVKALRTTADGIEVAYAQKGKEKTVVSEQVLMAVGRRPVVPEGCGDAGVEVGRRGIVVDDEFATTAPGIYAIGDCNGRCMLAHAASAQGRKVLGRDVRLDVVPSAVFTVPECAMVGLTEEQCEAQGIDFEVAKALYRANGKALAMGEPDGFAKMIVDRSSRLVVGCHIVGAHAADLVAEVALAMSADLPVDAIARTIHGHPTLSEVIAAASH